MVERNRIAIIPARGGSNRIPGKNIIDFRGRPMIAWTIQAALDSDLFDRVLVSTDDKRIAEVAITSGAEVPFLRDRMADDHATASQATIRALEQVEEQLHEKYRVVCQLMANCPMRTTTDIVEACTEFESSGATFQISCFRYGWMNPWWAVRLGNQNIPSPLFPEVAGRRSQDLDPLYCPTGAIWLAEVAALKQAGTFYGPDYRFYPIDWKSAVDIDEPEDLEMARAIATLAGR
jgi:CMP-N-acetylneuraminic acid synthetase